MIANLIRKNADKASPNLLRRLFNIFPPFLGAGIRITHVSEDFHSLRVELRRAWYNQNYVGTQFGGAMYMMTDPFYMVMLIQILGPEYVVWDKAATIEFIKPGKHRLVAEFEFTAAEITEIKRQTEGGEKLFTKKRVEIKDSEGLLVATVDKTLYVRKKDPSSRPK